MSVWRMAAILVFVNHRTPMALPAQTKNCAQCTVCRKILDCLYLFISASFIDISFHIPLLRDARIVSFRIQNLFSLSIESNDRTYKQTILLPMYYTLHVYMLSIGDWIALVERQILLKWIEFQSEACWHVLHIIALLTSVFRIMYFINSDSFSVHWKHFCFWLKRANATNIVSCASRKDIRSQ